MSTRHEGVRKTGAQHVLETIKSTGRTMIVAGLLSGVIAAILVEGFAVIATGSFTVPDVWTHVYAAVLALVCAYATVVTVLLRGVIATLVDSIEWVAGEVETLTSSIVHQAEAVLDVPDGHHASRSLVGGPTAR